MVNGDSQLLNKGPARLLWVVTNHLKIGLRKGSGWSFGECEQLGYQILTHSHIPKCTP